MAEKHSNPVLKRTITLRTDHAQRVHHRGFARTANSLHRVEVVLQIISDQKSVDDVEQVIDDLLDQYLNDISQEQERLATLVGSNGITGEPVYTSPKEISIEIASPQVSRFVRVLEEFERLVVVIDTLWLYGVFNNKQRKDSIYEWQRRSLRLGNKIVDIEKRAQRSAYNSGQEQEVAEQLVDPANEDTVANAEAASASGAESEESDKVAVGSAG